MIKYRWVEIYDIKVCEVIRVIDDEEIIIARAYSERAAKKLAKEYMAGFK